MDHDMMLGICDNQTVRTRSREFLAATIIVGWAAILEGTRPPFINEAVYLVRLRSIADPNYLPRDWSLKGSFGENLVFNRIFAPLAQHLSIVQMAWVGRFACWMALAWLIVGLGRRLRISPYTTACATCIWMPYQLHLPGADWIFATFESKPIAYCFLLAAMNAALDEKESLSFVCAGLSFSFHPGIGITGAVFVAIATWWISPQRARAARKFGLFMLAAAPGCYGILRDFDGSSGSRDFWKLMTKRIYPFHLNPWHFGLLTVIALAGMTVWLLANTRNRDATEPSRSQRFLRAFITTAAIPFVLGSVAYSVGGYEVLRFFPFRGFPVLASLLFALVASRQLATVSRRDPKGHGRSNRSTVALLGVILVACAASNPARDAAFLARRTWRALRQTSNDLDKTYAWIKHDTPRDSVVIAPPGTDPHFAMERSQIATFGVPRWDRVDEWQARVVAQLGASDGDARLRLDAGVSINDLYRQLTPEHLMITAERYRVDYFVTDQKLELTQVHRDGPWRVYQLNAYAPRVQVELLQSQGLATSEDTR